MANLKTSYMGIELKNPIIVGASNLVNNIGNVKKAEEAGAAAIVYKSLFEEQIQLENAQLDDQLGAYDDRHAEMVNIHPDMQHAGPAEHLFNLATVKKTVKIPVIASLNAIYKESWIEYAKQIENVGVDALELNFYYVPRDPDFDGHNLIVDQVSILEAVKSAVKIPVGVKLSPFYANPLHVISQLDKAGANGVVLFNRLFQPEIDVEKEQHYTPFNLSSPEDSRLSLRFTGLTYGNINASICSSTGIFNGTDVAKMILAGANAVQVVSTLYRNNVSHIKVMLKDLEAWMERKNYSSLDEFRGKLSNKQINNPFVYKRAQYIDLLLKSEEILNLHPTP